MSARRIHAMIEIAAKQDKNDVKQETYDFKTSSTVLSISFDLYVTSSVWLSNSSAKMQHECCLSYEISLNISCE